AGGALAVDRDAFSHALTERLSGHPLCRVERGVVDSVPDGPAIVATGPLTDDALAAAIGALPGVKRLNFFDAAAPIVTRESIDMNVAFAASRYGRGGDDYLNCPMDRAQYDAFYDALVGAEVAELHGFEKELVFEGCLAVEILAARGRQTLAFGPMKPVGIVDPRTGRPPYANVQLRQDNAEGTLYNLVGFQTRLKWGEQKRVFSMIPGLENAEFARYGVMHRNTYLNAPDALDVNFALRGRPHLRFAGQITGVEGYMESAASGMAAGLALGHLLLGRPEPAFSSRTMLGALMRHTVTPSANYQPMNANFGLLQPLDGRVRGRRNRYQQLSERALAEIDRMVPGLGLEG
ncbi:MAG: methylenetetrahydrofolate--tRNA-(uracil(54)-C(5))-methyltransferase (FADH(2)-oxidizing) TrmFO, partial [Clostridiales bacterium]|nr:methylenetetrahydrofolate--tRNA-(uracil(54)-C(5))-methyltransferase (FADH(2)-oxidizing) TrmFO [Clostridiales bacterium]